MWMDFQPALQIIIFLLPTFKSRLPTFYQIIFINIFFYLYAISF